MEIANTHFNKQAYYTEPTEQIEVLQNPNCVDFNGNAKAQLENIAPNNPMLYKLIKMKPKWGIDISIDYVSPDAVFEVFHYEWDSFEYEAVQEKKEEIENFIVHKDWDDIAQILWNRKNEWLNLDFFEQTQWRTDFFGLSPEKFKNVIWE